MTEEGHCPKCWKVYTSENVVGKNRTMKEGIRSTYEVVRCSCGTIFRGKKLEERGPISKEAQKA